MEKVTRIFVVLLLISSCKSFKDLSFINKYLYDYTYVYVRCIFLRNICLDSLYIGIALFVNNDYSTNS